MKTELESFILHVKIYNNNLSMRNAKNRTVT